VPPEVDWDEGVNRCRRDGYCVFTNIKKLGHNTQYPTHTMDPFAPEEFTTIEFDQIADVQVKPSPEKHLDSPITDGILRRMNSIVIDSHPPGYLHPVSAEYVTRYLRNNPQETYSGIRNQVIPYSRWLHVQKKTLSSLPAPLTAHEYPDLFREGIRNPTGIISDMACASRIYSRVVDAYCAEVSDVLKPDTVKELRTRLLGKTKISERLTYYATNAEYWDQVVEIYRKNYTRPNPTGRIRTITHGRWTFHMSDSVLILSRPGEDDRLLTYEQLQMIQDVCLSRENVYACISTSLHNGTDQLEELVGDLLHWQEDCIRAHGNDGYELVKAPESAYKAWVNTLAKGDIFADSSFNRTIRKIAEKEKKLSGVTSLTFRLERICRSTDHIADALELFGLVKLSGHPVVYAAKSARAVRDEAKPYMRTSPLSIFQTTRCFKHIVLSNFIAKEARWPPFRIPPAEGTLLRRHWNARTTALPSGSYDLADLDTIQFDKFLEFDYSQDFLKFLDDKAISAGASRTGTFWFGKLDTTKRLLLAALQAETLDMYQVVERLRQRKFDLDEMIIELTQKERELKPSARCFCKLTLEVRCFFALIEFNLGERLMKQYIPEQTMTMSTTETRKRLHSIASTTASRSNGGFLEIDFSRWNLRWRSRTVNPISAVIEDIFGMPGTYSQAHWFFENATVVLTDRHSIPAGIVEGTTAHLWPESDLVWRGHRGGFEGIQQKLWTVCTIAMVYMALLGLPMRFLMAGQGDNQILAITPSNPEVDRKWLFTKILSRLDIYCKSMGHDVKPEECIDSATVISYSKEFYVNGVHRLYTLKFASRTLKRDDSDIPSLSGEISGVCATAAAVADTLRSPIRAVWWMLFRLRRTMWSRTRGQPASATEKRLLREILAEESLFAFCSLLPGSLGGLPVQSVARFRIKGEVDDLIWDVCAVKSLTGAYPQLGRHLAALADGKYKPRRPDMEQLIVDPRSIPIERPSDQRRLIKDAVRAELPHLVRNKWLAEVLNVNVESVGRELITLLTSMRPMYPQIAQDIFSASLSGLSDSVYSRFTMTRTIKTVTAGSSFLHEIKSGNTRLLRFVLGCYRTACDGRGRQLTDAAYDIVSTLRKQWGIGDIQAGIGVYCPLDFRLTTDPRSAISASTRSDLSQVHTQLGPYPPNFGTRTRQKRSEHGYKILDSADTIKDIRSLVMIASELHAGPRLAKIISGIIQSRCPWDLTAMSRYMPTSIGGTAAHRHENLQSGFFCTLGSNTVPTHINYDTDNAGILSGGEEDYPIVFQEYFLSLNNHVSILSDSTSLRGPFTIRYHIPRHLEAIPSADCDLVDDPIGSTPWPTISPTNALAYVSDLQFSLYTDSPSAEQLPYASDWTHTDVLYSAFLVSLRYRQDALTSLRGAIIHAPDFLDIKEANRVTPHEMYLACASAVLIHAVSAAQKSFKMRDATTLHSALDSLISATAPSITKTLLHPSRREQKGVADLGIALAPGGMIPLAAVGAVCGAIRGYVDILLRTRNIRAVLPTLIIGKDKLGQAPTYLRMIICTLLVLELKPGSLVTGSLITRRLLAAESYGQASGTMEVAIQELRDVYTEITRAYDTHSNTPDRVSATRSFVIPAKQWHADQAELTRTLRQDPVVSHSVDVSTSELTKWTRTPETGKVEWKANPLGTHDLQAYQCNCAPDSSIRKMGETRAGYSWRVSGVDTSVRTLWNYLLALTPIRGKNVGVIGVGRGASAAAVLQADSRNTVVGLDLRKTWPLLTQRELSYIPPDVVASGLSSRFEWADEVWGPSGGDCFCLDLQGWIDENKIDAILIDIEGRDWDCIQLVAEVRVPVLGRFRLCTHEVSGLTEAVRKSCSSIYRIAITDVTYPPYLINVTFQGFGIKRRLPDQLTFRPFHPKPIRDRTAALRRINRITAEIGLEMTEYSATHLELAAEKLHNRSRTTSDQGYQTRIKKAAAVLLAIAASVRGDAREVLREYTTNEDIPRETARAVLLHLSNVVPDAVSYILPQT